MTLTPSLPTGSPAGLPLLAERRIWAGAVARAADGTPRTGILPAHFGAIVTGKASMGYTIAPFVAVMSRDGVGVEFVANDGVEPLDPAGYAGPLANTRLDVIWMRSRFTALGDPVETPEFGLTQGVASPTPQKPTIPAGALELAVAEVKSTDTTTQTVVITQTHRYTALAGGVVYVRNGVELDAWAPADGAQAYRNDTKQHLRRAHGRWIPATGVRGVATTQDGNQPVAGQTVVLTLTGGFVDGGMTFSDEADAFTVPVDGWYRVDGYVKWAANPTGHRGLGLQINTVGAADEVAQAASPVGPTGQSFSTIVYLTGGSSVKMVAIQSSGSTVNAGARRLSVELIR